MITLKITPFRNFKKKSNRETQNDIFLKIAIPFILSIVLGFTLILLGFIFLSIAFLTLFADTNEIPGFIWLLLGLFSELIGIYLMRKYLIVSPTPGTIKK